MNIQHLESLNDQVREFSGVQVRETVPDWVLKRADEIVLVDLTPGALLNRLDRGVVYPSDKAKVAKENFFREPTLAALREMALRQTAHEVDLRQSGFQQSASTQSAHYSPTFDAAPQDETADRERILIHVSDSPSTAGLIRRGRRVADFLRADCFAVAVVPGSGLASLPRERRESLERHLDFARRLHIDTRILEAEDSAEALTSFARTNGITQIFLLKPRFPKYRLLAPRKELAMRVIRAARDLQVTVVADRHTTRS